MSIKLDLREAMKEAMKAHDALKLDTVRSVISEVRNFEIDNGEQDDAGVQKIIAKLVKQWQDALADFKGADRGDLVTETEAKLEILRAYLPAQMTDEQLQAIVAEVVAAAPVRAMGPIIGQVMQRVAGQVDGGRVSAAVKAALG